MTDAVECLETHNEHSATILQALPLAMHLSNLAFSKQTGWPFSAESPLKCCKSTARQVSSGEEFKVGCFGLCRCATGILNLFALQGGLFLDVPWQDAQCCRNCMSGL